MPIPVSYTEDQLAEFMISALGDTGKLLELDSIHDFDEEVTEALLLYGADTIAEADDIRKLRVCARYVAWRKAMASLVSKYTFQADQQRFERSDVFRAAKVQMSLVESDLALVGISIGAVIEMGYLVPEIDPYLPVTDDDYV